MIMAFLSSRIRSWLLFAVLLPLVGRVLQALGLRARNPRVAGALTRAGGYAQSPPRAARYLVRRRRRR
jgi:hypothetical protein